MITNAFKKEISRQKAPLLMKMCFLGLLTNLLLFTTSTINNKPTLLMSTLTEVKLQFLSFFRIFKPLSISMLFMS